MNVFERSARDRKILRLVAAIDAELGERVTGPQAAAVAAQLGAWPEDAWVQLAKEKCQPPINPPSATTIAEVVLAYQRRAREQQSNRPVLRAIGGK